MQSVIAENAIKQLLRNRLKFVACYTPDAVTDTVDFVTGLQTKDYILTFTEGAILSSNEIQTFVADASLLGHSRHFTMGGYLDVSKRIALIKGTVVDDSVLVINGLRWDVLKVIESEYFGWKSVVLERVEGIEIYSSQVRSLIDNGWAASPRTTAYVDWLWLAVYAHYVGVIPGDLELWPIAGTAKEDSLDLLYPIGTQRSESGEVIYKEYGRNSGYTGTGLVGGVATDKAINLVQSNKPALASIIDSFNTFMGRK